MKSQSNNYNENFLNLLNQISDSSHIPLDEEQKEEEKSLCCNARIDDFGFCTNCQEHAL